MNNNLSKTVYVLLAAVFAVTAAVLYRAHRVDSKAAMPLANPKDAAEVYYQRIEATERLLQTNSLGL